jgi:hypothetical protein
MTTDPTTPPCLPDEPLSAAVREADAMLGMWAQTFTIDRACFGPAWAAERAMENLSDIPVDEVRALLVAALIRMTEPAS